LCTVVVAGGLLTASTTALAVPQLKVMLAAHETAPVRIDLDPLAQRSLVLAADGKTVLASLHGGENRQAVPLTEVAPVVVAAVLAIEDQDFYRHAGVDVRSMARALFTNVRSGDVRQGGSTITQQLVKNALLGPDRDFGRKIREAVLSVRLEHQLTKRQILERYLNTVYLGNGAYGVQAGAETYFGKDARDLGPAEAVLLAGLIKNPVGYDPFRRAEQALGRRVDVVGRLRRVSVIDARTARAILAAPLPTEPQVTLPKPDDHFVAEVVRRLLDEPALGRTRRERSRMVFAGGLRITTTLDPGLQRSALLAVRTALPDTGGRFTAALVSVDPATGAVRALVGGPGFERSKYNIATQGIGRQVGSAFKPFVLATALEQGISPRSTILGSGPCTFRNPGGVPDPYTAENFEGTRAGVDTLAAATKKSVNCAYLRLGTIVGLDNVIEMAHRLGVTAELAPNLSLPLGTSEVRPIDMAAAYATFAADGVQRRPYVVESVHDRDGRTLLEHRDEGRHAISAGVAQQVNEILEGVVTSGTARAARLTDGHPAAGKTGTTADYGDAWFVGYTRQLSTAVWMGSPVGNTLKMRNVAGVRRVTGGSFPARIWHEFMAPAHAAWPALAFAVPPTAEPGRYLRVARTVEVRRVRRATTTTTSQTEGSGPPDDRPAGRPGARHED
jgi:membrane peptidoglycan carboxypeptidase